MEQIEDPNTAHTARRIGAHHNLAGLWEVSYLPGIALTQQDAHFAMQVASGDPVATAALGDFARRNRIALDRIVTNLDGRAGTFHMASDDRPSSAFAPIVHTWHLQHDIYDDGRPAYVIGWEVWTGGYREVRRWTWDTEGLFAAGAWAMEHHATNRHSGCPPTGMGDFLAHAATPITWRIERDHQPSAPVVTCDAAMQITYQVDCSCGQLSSGWRFTEQLARREITNHRHALIDAARNVLRRELAARGERVAV